MQHDPGSLAIGSLGSLEGLEIGTQGGLEIGPLINEPVDSWVAGQGLQSSSYGLWEGLVFIFIVQLLLLAPWGVHAARQCWQQCSHRHAARLEKWWPSKRSSSMSKARRTEVYRRDHTVWRSRGTALKAGGVLLMAIHMGFPMLSGQGVMAVADAAVSLSTLAYSVIAEGTPYGWLARAPPLP